MLLDKFGQEGNGNSIPLPEDLVAEGEEEGAGFSFKQSQDIIQRSTGIFISLHNQKQVKGVKMKC